MKNNRTDVLKRFLRDIRRHTITVHQDSGVYRHIELSRPGTNTYRFDLVTFPGYLSVTGDMGGWQFSRLYDMFEFFQGDVASGINPGYWSEKLSMGPGIGRDELCYEFDEAAFERGLDEWLADYLEYSESDENKSAARDVVSELKGCYFRDEREAVDAAYNAAWPADVSPYDILEGLGTKTYSTHFLWVCYAIVWGIERYENKKVAEKAMDTFLAFRRSAA